MFRFVRRMPRECQAHSTVRASLTRMILFPQVFFPLAALVAAASAELRGTVPVSDALAPSKASLEQAAVDHAGRSLQSYDAVTATISIDDQGSSTAIDVLFTFGGTDYEYQATSYDPVVQTVTNCAGVILIYDVDDMVNENSSVINYGGGGFEIKWGLHATAMCGTGLSSVGSQSASGTWSES